MATITALPRRSHDVTQHRSKRKHSRLPPHDGPYRNRTLRGFSWRWPASILTLAAVCDWLTFWSLKSEWRHMGYIHFDLRVAAFDLLLTIGAGILWWMWWQNRRPPATDLPRPKSGNHSKHEKLKR